jgi:hypothetical protein
MAPKSIHKEVEESKERDAELIKCCSTNTVYKKASPIADQRWFIGRLYYRYTMMTGVSMLDPIEQLCLHGVYLVIFLFWYRYFSGFFFALFSK